MNEKRLRALLEATPAPDELEAQRRSWNVARTAFEEREPVGWPQRNRRALVLAAAAVAAVGVAAAAISPAGRALIGDVRDAIGRERVVGVERARPSLVSLPAEGRLLVASPQGAWVVRPDGSRRRLGAYDDARWSPRGLFVVAARGRQLVALEPDGDVRWSLSRARKIAGPRWSSSGFRIAYRVGTTLRLVAGDGTGDRLLARRVAPVAPAWHPGRDHVLAYADWRGRVVVVDADSGRVVWRTARLPTPRSLEWTADATLVVAGRSRIRVFAPGGNLAGVIELSPHTAATAAAVRPGSDHVAYAAFDRHARKSSVFLYDGTSSRLLFTGLGRFPELVWSPEGRWLLVAWPAADQWVFLRAPGVRRIVAVSNVGREFAPARRTAGPARPLAWCCAP